MKPCLCSHRIDDFNIRMGLQWNDANEMSSY